MTTHDIETRLQNLQPGDKFVYARSSQGKYPSRSALDAAMALYERGAVVLCQRRVGPFAYDYTAVGVR